MAWKDHEVEKRHNYFWQIIGTVLALVAIFATYDVYNKNRPIKELQIVMDSSISLIDVKPEARQDIEIFYRGQKVQNINLLQLSIINRGNQPILKSDYSENLSFLFDEGTQIVDASKISSEPTNIEVLLNVSNNQVVLSPILLNPEDSVKLRLLVISNNMSPTVIEDIRGRIVGIKDLRILSKSEKSKNNEFQILVTASLFTIIVFAIVGFIINNINYPVTRTEK